jgi:hypothetical protein
MIGVGSFVLSSLSVGDVTMICWTSLIWLSGVLSVLVG